MTEDDNLLYDIDGNWEQCNNGKRIYFRHKEHHGLFRIVDLEKEEIIFSDIDRVSKITDINKVLTHESDPVKLRRDYQALIVKVLNEIKPIDMPYKRQSIHAFIESFPSSTERMERDDVIGILYFWDTPDEKKSREKGILEAEMIPCRRFFMCPGNILDPYFKEIDFREYNKLKEEWMEREINEQDNTKCNSVCTDKGKGEA